VRPPYPMYIVVDDLGRALCVDEKFHGNENLNIDELEFGYDERHVAERYAQLHKGKVATLNEWKEIPHQDSNR